jgi:hypothetical protein
MFALEESHNEKHDHTNGGKNMRVSHNSSISYEKPDI